MRLLGLALILMSLGSSVHAADLECVRRVSDSRVHFAVIDMWPIMRIQTGREDCVGRPGFEFCVINREPAIMDANTVCDHQINQRLDCETQQWTEGFRTEVIETRCARGIRARLEISRSGQGKLTCVRRGRVEKTLRLGECY